MRLDIRIPIGLMFSVFGLLLVGFGLVGDQQIYSRSLGINVNFEWGLVLLVFGLVMLTFGRRAHAARRHTGAQQRGKAIG